MPPKPRRCIRCQPPSDGEVIGIGDRGYICDAHIELVNHPHRAHAPASPAGPQPAAGGRKKKRGRKRAASLLSVLPLLVFLPLAGCSFHRHATLDWGSLQHDSTIDLEVNPDRLLDAPRRPAPEP